MTGHPFRLVNPPPGQAAIIEAAIAAIDYPWERLAPALSNDRDNAVLVEWTDTGQGTSGLFWGHNYEIHLSTRNYHLDDGAAFVFAHEVGHLVDKATFTDTDRAALAALFHAAPGRYDGQQMNGAEHTWSHRQPHSEKWVDYGNGYLFRLDEAFADQFVAAFAPTVWDGTVLPGTSQRYPRFVHWTDDHAQVARLTLARDLTPEPVRATATPRAAKETPMPKGKRRRIRRIRRTIQRLQRRLRRLRRK